MHNGLLNRREWIKLEYWACFFLQCTISFVFAICSAECHCYHDWLFIYLFIYFIPFFPFFKVSGLELPLPPKKVFGNMDTTFIAERQNGLQNYVNFILAHPVLARHISVKRFLDPLNYSCDFQGTCTQSLCDKWNPLSGLSSIQPWSKHLGTCDKIRRQDELC